MQLDWTNSFECKSTIAQRCEKAHISRFEKCQEFYWGIKVKKNRTNLCFVQNKFRFCSEHKPIFCTVAKICSAFTLRYTTRLSERAALLKDLEHVLRLMMSFDDDTTVDFDEMMEFYCLVAGNRYFTPSL